MQSGSIGLVLQLGQIVENDLRTWDVAMSRRAVSKALPERTRPLGRRDVADGPDATAPSSVSSKLDPELLHVGQVGASASRREDAIVKRDIGVEGT